MSLKELLIAAQVAPVSRIEEALARHQLYGGDITSALVEQGAVDEARTLIALAEHYGLPAAPAGVLPYASAAALEAMPRETARRLGAYPFRAEEKGLTVVCSKPLTEDARSELVFSVKTEVHVLFALGPRVRQALARDYAFALDRETEKALAKLDSGTVQASSHPPVEATRSASFSQMPRPRTYPPFGFPDQWSDAETPSGSVLLAETVKQPSVAPKLSENSEQPPQAARNVLPGPSSAPPRPPSSSEQRRSGAYPIAEAQTALLAAETVGRVVELTFDYCAQYFDHTVLMALQSHQALIKEIRGSGGTLQPPDSRLLLAEHPLLQELAERGQWQLTSLQSRAPGLAKLLSRPAAHDSLLFPIRVRGRCKMLLCGGLDGASVSLATVGELLGFEALVGQAFERAILLRKAGPGSRRGQTERTQATTVLAGLAGQRSQAKASTREGGAHVLAGLVKPGDSRPPSR